MSDARTEILARIRRALGQERPAAPAANSGPAVPAVPAAPAAPPDQVDPAAGAAADLPSQPDLLALLADRLRDYRAEVHVVTPDELPAALRSTMEGVGRVVVPPGLPAGWAPPGAFVDDGTLGPADLDACHTVLTACTAAAAETGTIALDGSPDQGRRAITLIPDRHVCVVRAGQVVRDVPDLLARLDPARPLTLISGPSATSDIELHRVEGVHGPRTLVVLLVSGSGTGAGEGWPAGRRAR